MRLAGARRAAEDREQLHAGAALADARAIDHLQPGEIILMHVGANPADHSTLDADALPRIIDAIRAHGYQFVTLPPYF